MTAAVAASATVTALIVRKGVHKKISFMLDALEDGETNFRFSERMRPGRGLNKTLNRIRTIFRKERHQIMEQEKYYGQMLDNVKTGVIVSAVKGEEVLYCNKRALSLLGFSSLSTLRQLKKISPEVYTAFSWVDEDSPQKAGFFSDKSPCNISIAATRTLMQGNEVKIITFNDISGEIEDNEVTSWTRLIRVLTHEIMNTVTPIASLSEVLQTCVDDPAKKDDLKAGLETISTSSRGLVKFVESYRNLTRVANPVKKAFFVRDMAAKVIDLTSAFGAEVTFVEKTEDVLLYADEGQISQILVNLVKNAAQAGARNVGISAEIDSADSVIVNVSNDGPPISEPAREEIFIPFFTTKQDGTGIGLSLSRQIMRLHGGTLRLTRSDEKETVFSLIFK